MRSELAVVGLFAALAGLPADASEDRTAEKEDAVVFLDALGKDAAPAPDTTKDVVVLSEVPEKDPYFAAVAALGVDVKEVVPFKQGSLDAAFRRLKELRPGNVVVLIRPTTLDVNFHFEFLERASRLDDDPFVDFAFGYLTGATADECVAFAKGIAAARETQVPRTILEFGPVKQPVGPTDAGPHPWAKDFQTRRFLHKEGDAGVAAALKALRGIGLYHASGHGSPDRVADGVTGAQVRASGLDLFPAVYFSGPCWCGTTSRWFDVEKGAVVEKKVAPEESFVLALIKARATGVVAGLDPDRGEYAEHEVENLLVAGGPIGLAAKSTYDDVALSYRRPKLELPRYQVRRDAPFRDIHDQMIAGGACRALFGDPTFAPFPSSGTDFFRVEKERTKEGLFVTWRCDGNLNGRWAPVDICRSGKMSGNWSQRVRFVFDLPRAEAQRLKTFKVVSMTKDGKDLAYVYPTAALESWGDVVRVHGMLIFPKQGNDAPLGGARALEARFVFRE